MGFFDLSGALDRQFGSIGVALNEISTRISVTRSAARLITGPSAEKADYCLSLLCQSLNVSDQVNITIEEAIPEHVGLGSGTQMSLAIGSALNALYCLGLSVREIAEITERGQRSGIGIGIFEQGGLVVDGGRGSTTLTPPVIAQMSVPEDWRFILIFDSRGQGLHGIQEIQAFNELPPFSVTEAQRLCHLLLMQGLPALAEHDLTRFGEVITQLQTSVGTHFAAAQGGVFTSSEVASVMAWLVEQGAVAIGQTSWGPTGFCAVSNAKLADMLIEQLNLRFAHFDKLSFLVASPRNNGGYIRILKHSHT